MLYILKSHNVVSINFRILSLSYLFAIRVFNMIGIFLWWRFFIRLLDFFYFASGHEECYFFKYCLKSAIVTILGKNLLLDMGSFVWEIKYPLTICYHSIFNLYIFQHIYILCFDMHSNYIRVTIKTIKSLNRIKSKLFINM